MTKNMASGYFCLANQHKNDPAYSFDLVHSCRIRLPSQVQ